MSVWAGLPVPVSQICSSPQLQRAYVTTPLRCTVAGQHDQLVLRFGGAGALLGFLPPACRHISPKRRAVVVIRDTSSVVIATSLAAGWMYGEAGQRPSAAGSARALALAVTWA
jgi:hypothetical protein